MLLYRWLLEEKYVTSLRDFRRLTLAQINLFIEKSKELDEWKKNTAKLNKNLR